MHPVLAQQLTDLHIDQATLPDDLRTLLTRIGESYETFEAKQKTLTATNEKLTFIFDTTPLTIGFIRVEDEHTYIYEMLNKFGLTLSHATAESVIGKKVNETFPDAENNTKALNELQEVYRTKKRVRHETNFEAGGMKFYLISDLIPVVKENGSVSHIIGITQDISDRRRVEEKIIAREQQLSLSQHIAHIGSWEWDPKTGAVAWSDETYRILGYEPGEITPTFDVYLNHIQESQREEFKKQITESQEKNESFLLEVQITTKDNTLRYVNIQGQPFETDGGTVKKFICINQDITEQKQAQEKIMQRTKELEKLNAVMIGRELKMMELKKEIDQLHEQQHQSTSMG